MSREKVYAEFLRLHAPSKCNVFFGGFLFGANGEESGQVDVIVTTDTAPRFNFFNRDGQGKAFSPVDGTLGIASIKSTLDKKALEEALAGIASIPLTLPLAGRLNPNFNLPNSDDWPYKIVYASDGIAEATLLGHLHGFYSRNPTIPYGRRPNIIHAAGKYVIARGVAGLSVRDPATGVTSAVPAGEFNTFNRDPDLQGILWVLDRLQHYATASTHILYSYNYLVNEVNREV